MIRLCSPFRFRNFGAGLHRLSQIWLRHGWRMRTTLTVAKLKRKRWWAGKYWYRILAQRPGDSPPPFCTHSSVVCRECLPTDEHSTRVKPILAPNAMSVKLVAQPISDWCNIPVTFSQKDTKFFVEHFLSRHILAREYQTWGRIHCSTQKKADPANVRVGLVRFNSIWALSEHCRQRGNHPVVRCWALLWHAVLVSSLTVSNSTSFGRYRMWQT